MKWLVRRQAAQGALSSTEAVCTEEGLGWGLVGGNLPCSQRMKFCGGPQMRVGRWGTRLFDCGVEGHRVEGHGLIALRWGLRGTALLSTQLRWCIEAPGANPASPRQPLLLMAKANFCSMVRLGTTRRLHT